MERTLSNPSIYQPFPAIPAAVAWLELFRCDALRYPLLIVLGQSHSGKTQWANSLFSNPLEVNIGALEHFPEKLRQFNREVHDGLVLDDIRDMEFLATHQDTPGQPVKIWDKTQERTINICFLLFPVLEHLLLF